MKRFIPILMILALLLSGCSSGQDESKDSVMFYYLQSRSEAETYDAFFSQGAIGAEKRDISGHRQDLNYLIALYLHGPMNDLLESPFPSDCRLNGIKTDADRLIISLDTELSGMSEIDITVAFACLAKTCMELTDAETVQIEAATEEASTPHTRAFTRDSLLLTDTPTNDTEPSE